MRPRAASLIALLFASACGPSPGETTSDEAPAAAPVEPEPPPAEPEPPPSEPEPAPASEPSEPPPAPARTALRHQISSSCVIRSDGLSCWSGRDAQRVAIDSKPVSVSGRCALLESGAVVCFEPDAEPRKIGELEGVSALASSAVTTCGVRAGEVVCLHASGKQSVVEGLTDAVDLTLNDRWGCAIRAAGTVSCWETMGWEDGKAVEHFSSDGPAQHVRGLKDVVEVSVRGRIRCARTEPGDVLCWKDSVPDLPIEVEGIAGATGIAAAWIHSCALVDREVLCWDEYSGPTRLPDIEDAVALSSSSEDFFCALQADDRVKCWAPNSVALTPHGQDNPVWHANVASARVAKLGVIGPIVLTEAGTLELLDPVWAKWAPELARLSDVVDFAVEPLTARGLCVVTKGEGLRCWHHSEKAIEPEQVASPESGFHDTSMLSGGDVCGISADGQLFCMDIDGLQRVKLGSGMGKLVDAASGGGWNGRHRCGVDSKGQLRCIGANESGELGQGHNKELPNKPVTPKGVRDVAEVDVESYYTCARTKKGRVWCWGGAAWDRGERSEFPLPHDIGVNSAVQIAVGDELACARDQDNAVWCWHEQVRGSPADDVSVPPYEVPGLKGSTDIRVNRGRVCGVQASEVRCWWSGMADAQVSYMTLPVEVGVAGPTGKRFLDVGRLFR